MSRMLTQALPIEVRELPAREMPDGAKKRRFSFTGATERGVATPWGREHLRMSGANLERYRSNPVVLDAHNRFSALSVIGRADVRREGRALVFDVEFADTRRGKAVEKLVADGILRACSVGFMPAQKGVRILDEMECDGEGEDRVTGPATVITEWELLELSMVPVGADADALRREFYQEVRAMSEPVKQDQQQPAPAPAAAATKQCPAAPKAEERAAPATPAPAPVSVTRAEIEAICPRGLEADGERCLIRGLTLAETRAVLLEAHARRCSPVGTPEPPAASFRGPPAVSPATSQQAQMPLTAAELKRALVGF